MTEPESLVTGEGVDEGSADSTAEGPGSGRADLLGAPAQGRPVDGSQPAGPSDPETAQSREARADRAPGQQLSAGEG